MKYTYALIAFIALSLTNCKSSKYADLADGIYADIQTNRGDIIIKLEHEKTPVTVANFISLAEGNNPFVSDSFKDKKYYDGVLFHRVIADFMIQGGDPTATGLLLLVLTLGDLVLFGLSYYIHTRACAHTHCR